MCGWTVRSHTSKPPPATSVYRGIPFHINSACMRQRFYHGVALMHVWGAFVD